jgi:bacterioferritin-associated ferredoxin
MYVCICNAYRESNVRDAIRQGADDNGITVEQIYARLGRGLRCGQCSSYVQDMINVVRESRDEVVAVP